MDSLSTQSIATKASGTPATKYIIEQNQFTITYKNYYYKAWIVLRGVVAPCGGVYNKVPQLHITPPEPLD